MIDHITNAKNINELPSFDADDYPKISRSDLRSFGISKVKQLRAKYDSDVFDSVAEVVGADKMLKIIFNLSEDDIRED